MSEVFSASVAIALRNKPQFGESATDLVLVTQKDTGKLGLIAGHMEKETHFDAAYRELKEETGLTAADITLENNPKIVTIPKEAKTSIGIVFNAKTKRHLPKDGYVPPSDEVSLVKPYTIDELLFLLKAPETFYKPEFNVPVLSRVIWSYISIKYDLDGSEFQHSVADSWGVPKEHRALL